MKELLKSSLERAFPSLYPSVIASRARARSQRLEEAWGCVALTGKYLRSQPPVVVTGPFTGLEFTPRTHRRHIVPKLLGAYELELHGAFEEVIARGYDQVLDVGAAEGYYAVGLGRRMPQAQVVAFDIDHWSRATVAEMAAANGTEKVTIEGACTPDWLSRKLRPDAFILSDCEGYEDILLDPSRAPALLQADMLVELHEDQAPGVTNRLIARFAATHHATLVDSVPRDPASFRNAAGLTATELALATSDIRPAGQQWLYLTRNTG